MKQDSYNLFIKAFGSPIRLQIISLLRRKHMSVTEICSRLGLEQSLVSHNLKCLVDCGFIKNSRYGRRRIYHLNKRTVEPVLRAIDRHVKTYRKHLVECGVIR